MTEDAWIDGHFCGPLAFHNNRNLVETTYIRRMFQVRPGITGKAAFIVCVKL